MKQLNATQCARFIQKHVPKNKRGIVLSTLVDGRRAAASAACRRHCATNVSFWFK